MSRAPTLGERSGNESFIEDVDVGPWRDDALEDVVAQGVSAAAPAAVSG